MLNASSLDRRSSSLRSCSPALVSEARRTRWSSRSARVLTLEQRPRIGPDKRASVEQSDQLPACRQLGSYRPESERVGQLLARLLKLALMRPYARKFLVMECR